MSADQNSALVKVLAPALAESEVGRLATQAILTDVIGTIGEYLGQCFVGDAAGASEAMAALRVAVQPLAKAIDSRELLLAQLREAVRVQTPVFDLVCYGTANPATGQREIIVESRNMQCARIPVHGEYIEDDEGRSWRVYEIEHRGASVLVTAEGTGWSAIVGEALGADEETRL